MFIGNKSINFWGTSSARPPTGALPLDPAGSALPPDPLLANPSKLHRDIGYVPPTDTGSLCLAVDSTHTVVPGLFRMVRRSGTHCQMNSEIRRVMSTASNSSLKQSCSALTSVTNALEVIFNVMRSINPRFTYLLTYPYPPANSSPRTPGV